MESGHNIKFKKAHNKKDSADKVGAEEWKSSKLPILMQNFCADDIYNADETGLCSRATPDGSLCYKHDILSGSLCYKQDTLFGSLCYKHDTLSGSKKAMDSVTVLCCSNMPGTDKQKLLVIGKSTKPRCFKGIKMESLPVQYYANKNAWMTSGIFKNWLMSWDMELQYRENNFAAC